jgi:hypothetical protein
MGSVDVPTALAPQQSVAFLSQVDTDGEGVTGARAFAESILPMVHYGLADHCERFIAGQ